MNLEELGISKEKLQELVVERVSEEVLHGRSQEEDGGETLSQRLRQLATDAADARVVALFAEYIEPRIAEFIDGLILQKTNEWGEAQGKSFTFIEYLIDRAEKHIAEPVDYRGRSESECKSQRDSFRKAQGRLVYMVDDKLQYSIKIAMEKAMEDANSVLADGIATTVKAQMADIAKNLKVSAKVR